MRKMKPLIVPLNSAQGHPLKSSYTSPWTKMCIPAFENLVIILFFLNRNQHFELHILQYCLQLLLLIYKSNYFLVSHTNFELVGKKYKNTNLYTCKRLYILSVACKWNLYEVIWYSLFCCEFSPEIITNKFKTNFFIFTVNNPTNFSQK